MESNFFITNFIISIIFVYNECKNNNSVEIENKFTNYSYTECNIYEPKIFLKHWTVNYALKSAYNFNF